MNVPPSAPSVPGGAPVISVVTPCRNAAAFVGETLAAVRAQRCTAAAIEHIVVDDASDDDSWAVLQRAAATAPGLRLLRLPAQRGGSHARNRGAELARGDFLMFLDADDLLAPGTLEALWHAARQRPATVAVCECLRWKQQPDGSWGPAPRERPVPQPETDLYRAFLELSAWPPTCSVLWRRDAYERTGGWDETLVRDQDTDVLLRAYARGVRLVRADHGVGYYRTFDGTRATTSSGVSTARLAASIRVLDKLAAELDRCGALPAYARLLSRAYHQRAAYALQLGLREPAREALRKGRAIGGRQVVSQTAVGRALERAFGLERKERIAQVLGRGGIGTRRRRQALQRGQALHAPIETL